MSERDVTDFLKAQAPLSARETSGALVGLHLLQAPVVVQHAHGAELGQRDGVDAARGGEDGVRHGGVVAHALDELADARAGGLEPAQARRERGQLGATHVVEVEEHVGARQVVAPALLLLLRERARRADVVAGVARRGQQLGLAHREVGQQDGQEAGRVEEEAGGQPDQPDDEPGHGRADDARSVEDGAVEGHRVGHVGPSDHLDHERLADRHLDGIHEAEPDGQQVDHPDLDGAGHHEQPQGQRQAERHELGHDERLALGQRIGDEAAEEPEGEDGQELAGRGYAERERIVGQLQDEPALGNGLHPGAHQRDELAGEEEAEVAVPERGADGRAHAGPASDAAVTCRAAAAMRSIVRERPSRPVSMVRSSR